MAYILDTISGVIIVAVSVGAATRVALLLLSIINSDPSEKPTIKKKIRNTIIFTIIAYLLGSLNFFKNIITYYFL